MRFLVAEKLGPHKFKTPEGYLICTDAILSRTGKQEYKRCELFGDACEDPDKIVNVDRTDDEVFSDKAMASFENKAVCVEHPDHDVNAENHNELAVGFVRDIHKGEDGGKPVMMGTLVITDKDAVEAVESGEYKELSCGYDCDIDDDGEPRQRNIRGNHVALCKQGRAGIARIVDSNDKIEVIKGMKDIQTTKAPGTDKIIYVMQSDIDENLYFYIGKKFSMKEGAWGYSKFEMGEDTPEKIKAELARNGWHQVTNGPARIIDASNEEWTVVEEENYNKANKAIGAKDATQYYLKGSMGEYEPVEIVSKEGDGAFHKVVIRHKNGKTETTIWNRLTSKHPLDSKTTDTEHEYEIIAEKYGPGNTTKKITVFAASELEAINYAKRKLGKEWRVVEHARRLDSKAKDSKEQLFTIEYEQDGVMHVRKVRASSIEDAIKKARDSYDWSNADANAFEKVCESIGLKTHAYLPSNKSMQITVQENRDNYAQGVKKLRQLGYKEVDGGLWGTSFRVTK